MADPTTPGADESKQSSAENDETEERLHALDHRAISASLIKHISAMFNQAEQLSQNAISAANSLLSNNVESANLVSKQAIKHADDVQALVSEKITATISPNKP